MLADAPLPVVHRMELSRAAEHPLAIRVAWLASGQHRWQLNSGEQVA